jgi:hypothetical protein
MMNVFRFSKSIINTFSAHIDSCRISTFGMFDQEKNEEKLFFPLENIRELMYYYGIPRQILEEDGRLFRRITDQIKVKSKLRKRDGFSAKSNVWCISDSIRGELQLYCCQHIFYTKIKNNT